MIASPGYRVAPGLPDRYSDQAHERPGRGEGVQPGMPGIGDERGGSDALADHQLVPGDDLVADDADDCPSDTHREVGGVAVVDELSDTLVSGKGSAGPDDQGDSDTGQVLGPFQAIGVALGRQAPGQPNPRNTTALVETSDKLWIASPSRPTEPVTIARSSSMTPVAASPMALTATARLASRRSFTSSRSLGSGDVAAGHGPRWSCVFPQDRRNQMP